MNFKFIALILGIITASLTVSAATTKGIVYLADKRYITQEAWIAQDKERDRKLLKREIRELEVKEELNIITPYEKAIKKELIREYKETFE